MIDRIPYQSRECARPGCTNRWNPSLRESSTPQRYCSTTCWRSDKPASAPKPRSPLRAVQTPKKRKPISPASPAQRTAIKDRACLACAAPPGSCDPAHLIDRSVAGEGQEDPLAVIPLCRQCHTSYDQFGGLDVLPFLEPHHRDVLAFAVERYGLLRTLQRVTNRHWIPSEREAA